MKRFSNLPYHFGLKVRCYPSYRQRAIIKTNSDIYRYWYNRQLGLDYYKYDIMQKYGYGHRIINPLILHWYRDVYNKRKITYAKQMNYWLRDRKIDSLTCNTAYQNHKRAWTNYRNHLQRVPKFHSRKRQGYTWKYQTTCLYHKNKSGKHIGSVQVLDKNHVQIPKLKRIRTSEIRDDILNKSDVRFSTVTVTKDNLDQYYLSFQLGSMTPFVRLNDRANGLAELGYDLNTSNFLMDTDRDNLPNPRYYKRKEKKYKWLAHCLSRKYRHNSRRHLKNCKNYQRNRLLVARIKKHVKNQRRDFLQRHSTELIENQDFLAGENLQSHNMLKNHRIAKSIQSVGWRSFISMLSYKALMYHRIYVLVNPAYTTQKCSKCGFVCTRKNGYHLTLKDREWTCPKCGTHHIRDINASLNILNEAYQAVKPYLPKSLRASMRMATSVKQVQRGHPRWLQYLVTHFYGVLDTSGQGAAKLIRED